MTLKKAGIKDLEVSGKRVLIRFAKIHCNFIWFLFFSGYGAGWPTNWKPRCGLACLLDLKFQFILTVSRTFATSVPILVFSYDFSECFLAYNVKYSCLIVILLHDFSLNIII